MNELTQDKVALSYDEAVAMLPGTDEIHTFIQQGIALIGADWPRETVLDLLKVGSPELAGEMATRMGHGLVAYRGCQPVFIETKEEADND